VIFFEFLDDPIEYILFDLFVFACYLIDPFVKISHGVVFIWLGSPLFPAKESAFFEDKFIVFVYLGTDFTNEFGLFNVRDHTSSTAISNIPLYGGYIKSLCLKQFEFGTHFFRCRTGYDVCQLILDVVD
jgi:hypothetical protein